MHADSQPPQPAPTTAAASYPSRLRETLGILLGSIYPQQDTAALTGAVLEAFFAPAAKPSRRGRTPGNTPWSEKDSYLICYGNIVEAGHLFLDNPMETPFIPNWSRVNAAYPDLLRNLRAAVIEDNAR